MFIDASMQMPELTNDKMKNYSVDNKCYIFEDNYIFVENFSTSSWSYQPIP